LAFALVPRLASRSNRLFLTQSPHRGHNRLRRARSPTLAEQERHDDEHGDEEAAKPEKDVERRERADPPVMNSSPASVG